MKSIIAVAAGTLVAGTQAQY